MKNSASTLEVLEAIWAIFVWLPRSSWSPRAPPDDTSDRFSFLVKRGLVTELCFLVCLNNALGSFVGPSIFIFSLSPLSSACTVVFPMLILGGIFGQLLSKFLEL